MLSVIVEVAILLGAVILKMLKYMAIGIIATLIIQAISCNVFKVDLFQKILKLMGV